MEELINVCFNGDDKELIRITRYDAIWSDSQEKCRLSVNEISLNK